MNCQSFETVVNDLAREQMMEANAQEEALAHSGDCEACALRLSVERRLTVGLRALVAEMKSVSAPARVEEHLLEAFRSQTALLPKTRPENRSRYWLVAAAALVLFAFGIAGIRWALDRPAKTPSEKSINTEGEKSSKSPILAIEHSNPEPTSNRPQLFYRPSRKQSVWRTGKRPSNEDEASVAQRRARGTDTTEVSNSAESEVTTQFLPLSYTSPVNLQDGGQLVRVELPRSTMARLGLPVNIERYDERVKADVLVSADGLARLIRFVQ